MQVNSFVEEIKRAYYEQFPKGWIYGGYKEYLGKFVSFTFGVQPKEKWANGIEHNDPARHVIMIHDCSVDGLAMKSKVKMEFACGGSIYIKPDKESFYAYDLLKFGARKKSSSPEKIVDHLEKYFKTMRKIIDENRDKLKDDID